MLPDKDIPSNEEVTEEIDLHKRLHSAVPELDTQERDIIIRRHGMNGGRIYTLEELGESHGLCIERVRQI